MSGRDSASGDPEGREHEPDQPSRNPGASPFRRAVERRSAPAVFALRRGPRWLLPLVAVALLLAGLTAPGWAGGLALFGLAGLLGWLAYLSGPSLGGGGLVLRAVAIAVLLGVAALRSLGHF